MIGQVISANNLSDQLRYAVESLAFAVLLNAFCYVMESDATAPQIRNHLLRAGFLFLRMLSVTTATSGIAKVIEHVSPGVGLTFGWVANFGLWFHILVHQRQFKSIRHGGASIVALLRRARLRRQGKTLLKKLKADGQLISLACTLLRRDAEECRRAAYDCNRMVDEHFREVKEIQAILKAHGVEVGSEQDLMDCLDGVPVDVRNQLVPRIDRIRITVGEIENRRKALTPQFASIRERLDALDRESEVHIEPALAHANRIKSSHEALAATCRHHIAEWERAEREAEEWLPRIMKSVEAQQPPAQAES